jgi:hypothetical protein
LKLLKSGLVDCFESLVDLLVFSDAWVHFVQLCVAVREHFSVAGGLRDQEFARLLGFIERLG